MHYHEDRDKPEFLAYRTPFGTLIVPNLTKDEYARDNIGQALPEPIKWGRRAEQDLGSRMLWHGHRCPADILKRGMFPEEFVAHVNSQPAKKYRAALKRWDKWYNENEPWWLDERGAWQCEAWVRRRREEQAA